MNIYRKVFYFNQLCLQMETFKNTIKIKVLLFIKTIGKKLKQQQQ